jgi:hypothetical protein
MVVNQRERLLCWGAGYYLYNCHTNTTSFIYGTLAYEDLWPSKGDYDFNDLVVDYDFNIVKNNQEVAQNCYVRNWH